MVRRLFLTLLLSSLLGCYIGDTKVTINYEYFSPKDRKREITNSDIEKKIRLFEPHVADLIKSDYTVKRKRGELCMAFSDHGYNGLYNESEDTGFIPEHPRSKEKALDALCEEVLAHASTDDIGHKGIFYSPRYTGPSIEEIRAKMKERFDKEDMVKTKNRWEGILELRYMMDEVQKLMGQLKIDHQDIAKILPKIGQDKDIEEIRVGLEKKVKEFQKNNTDKRAEQLYKQVNKGGFKSLPDEAVSYLSNFVQGTLNGLSEMGKGVCELRGEITKKFPKLEIDFNPFDYDFLPDYAKEAKGQIDQEFCFKEQFGKTIYSLYNLYYGKTIIEAYELDEPMLQFLEGFILDGLPMFRKQIEKYRVGKQMVNDGSFPNRVRELLIFATEFEYDGRKYHWPYNDFTIKGTIPDEYSLEYMSID